MMFHGHACRLYTEHAYVQDAICTSIIGADDSLNKFYRKVLKDVEHFAGKDFYHNHFVVDIMTPQESHYFLGVRDGGLLLGMSFAKMNDSKMIEL